MGALHGNRCHASQGDALDAFYASVPFQFSAGPTAYASGFEFIAGQWKSVGYSIDGAGVWSLRYSTAAPVPSFPYCDEAAGFKDGITLGWGIASALIAVSALMLMKRGAR
jgi:hypothetical protein